MNLGAPLQRAVLVVLALSAGRPMSRTQLVDALWGDEPPASAAASVYTYVAGLRRALDPARDRRAAGGVLLSSRYGYTLRLQLEQLDVTTVQQALTAARRFRSAGKLTDAATAFEDALTRWSGSPLAGIPGPFAETERARLVALRLDALEERAELMLETGQCADAAADLSRLARQHPLRERLWALLMLALHGCSRQAEALAAYTQARRLLIAELGIEPGYELQRVHRQLLSGAGDDPRPGISWSAQLDRDGVPGRPADSRPVHHERRAVAAHG